LRYCLCTAIAKHCGRHGSRETVSFDPTLVLSPLKAPLEQLIRCEVSEKIAAEMLQLTRLDQIVLFMKYYEDLDIDSIAAEVGLSSVACRKRIDRARMRLGDLLA
jgi:DNA-directed RNA polymerase specialized sigma24 family protein